MRLLPVSLVTLLYGLSAIAAGAQQIGVVASVDPQMRGAPPGQAARVLGVGAALVASETVTTSATGRGQILFLDQTTLTLSPDSEIVLDAFVFDHGGRGGSAGLRLTRGALRFIGGKTSRQREATIRTPTLIIGIRGSSALVSHEAGASRAILIAGDRLCVSGAGGNFCTNRQGGILTEGGYAGQVTQAELTRVLGRVDGPPLRGAPFAAGQAGGGQGGGQGGSGGGLAGLTGGDARGTGIVGDTDPRGAPLSSRGEQRSFEVFDEAVRSEALRGILSVQTAAPPPPPAPEPDPQRPQPPAPQPPDPTPPRPEPSAPEPPVPPRPTPEPPAPEPEPEPPGPEPEVPEVPGPEPDPDGPFIIIDVE